MILDDTIHFWDMDHTIMDNDCDISWKSFLIEEGLAPADALQTADLFYEEYCLGKLDFDAFMKFQVEEFRGSTEQRMLQISQKHFENRVKQTLYPQAQQMIKKQLAGARKVILLTATNHYIAKPVADYLGIKSIVATNLELSEGVFTGKTTGIYCCAQGKFQRLLDYCHGEGLDETRAAYYGDSHNDIAVFEKVSRPIAVNPVDTLRERAHKEGWQIIDFKKNQ